MSGGDFGGYLLPRESGCSRGSAPNGWVFIDNFLQLKKFLAVIIDGY